jgi:hypothetical protein
MTPCYLTALSSNCTHTHPHTHTHTHTHTHENLHKWCLGLFRNRSTSEMAVTTYQSTWPNISEDLHLSTKSVGISILYFQTPSSRNNYPESALNNVGTVTWLAIPTHYHPYFGFASSTGPQFSVRQLQQYRQHNKINKNIFPDFFYLTTCTHALTPRITKFYRYDVLTKASSPGPSAVHTQPESTARPATT